MKISFVFDGLGFGGIERVGLDFINLCKKSGHEVDVYNLSPKYGELAGQLPEGVKYFKKRLSTRACPELYSYGVKKWWWGKYAYAMLSPFVTLGQGIKKLFTRRRKYDVAIAFSGHINDLSFVAKRFIKADKKICWCHGNIIAYFAICDAYPMLYKKIDKFVTLSSAGQKNIYAGHKYMRGKKIYKIYNPTFIREKQVDGQTVNELKEKYGDFILTVGRFAEGKGHDIAIQTVKSLKERGLEKHIVFLGDGPIFADMQELAKKLGVEELCHFEGVKTNVCDYITASHINLLSSQWEGLPTVIVEAMTLGKPCVMTNSDDGEVSGGGKYCKLTEIGDVGGLTQALTELYTDTAEYEKYCALSLERAEAFSPAKICEQLKELLGG